MPEFTDGMSTLVSCYSIGVLVYRHATQFLQLQNEGWGIRGKIKKAAVKLIDKMYRIYPPSNKYTRYPNADEMEMRYIEQRVKTLLGPQSLYIRGYLEGQVCTLGLVLLYVSR